MPGLPQDSRPLQGTSPSPTGAAPQSASPERTRDREDRKPLTRSRVVASAEGWWTVYQDPQLDSLERQVRVTNQTLPQAEAAWRTAVGIARTTGPSTSPYNLFSVVVSGSWDVELWDRIHKRIETHAAAARASDSELTAAELATQTALAVDYMGLRLADEQKELLNEMQANCNEAIAVLESRFKTGTASSSELVAARARLAAVSVQLIGADVPRLQLEHAIALLAGQQPANVSISPGKLAGIPMTPQQLPSSLLERRPDVAAALKQMQAAGAQPGVSASHRFPSLMLSGQSAELRAVLSSNDMASLAETPTGTSGTSSANQTAYRQTVLEALQQVEDELSTLRNLEAQYQAAGEAVNAASTALTFSRAQYKSGTVNYYSVVTAEGDVLVNRQTQLTVQHNYLVASVMLMQALGGGWSATAPSETGETRSPPSQR